MQINFYTITDEKKVINKNLGTAITLEGNFKNSTSIVSPTIQVKRNDLLLNCNYLYIDKFKRYYFITDIVIDEGFFNLSCDVDVLESFKSEILESEQVISRQEFKFNLQLKDEKIQRYNKVFQVVKKIGETPFNTEFIDERGLNFVDPNRFNFAITVTNDELVSIIN